MYKSIFSVQYVLHHVKKQFMETIMAVRKTILSLDAEYIERCVIHNFIITQTQKRHFFTMLQGLLQFILVLSTWKATFFATYLNGYFRFIQYISLHIPIGLNIFIANQRCFYIIIFQYRFHLFLRYLSFRGQ